MSRLSLTKQFPDFFWYRGFLLVNNNPEKLAVAGMVLANRCVPPSFNLSLSLNDSQPSA